jgi:hypothetical protein
VPPASVLAWKVVQFDISQPCRVFRTQFFLISTKNSSAWKTCVTSTRAKTELL